MPYIIRDGNNVFKNGNTLFAFGKPIDSSYITLTLASASSGDNGSYDRVTSDPAKDRLFVCNSSDISIYALSAIYSSPITWAVASPRCVAVDPGQNRIFVATASNVSVYNYTDLSFIQTLPYSNQYTIGVNPGNYIAVGTTVLDYNTLASTGTFSHSSRCLRMDISGGRIFAPMSTATTVNIYNPSTFALITSLSASQYGATTFPNCAILGSKIYFSGYGGSGVVSSVPYADPLAGASTFATGIATESKRGMASDNYNRLFVLVPDKLYVFLIKTL